MKIHFLLGLVGLAIGFAAPALAQLKDTVDPKTAQEIRALPTKYDAAVNNDAAAAKAAAGREALSRAPADVPVPVGTFITFDVPGAVNGTYPASINPAGAITGYYNDANFLSHGFLRTSDGTFITFDVPGAVNGTFPSSINAAGAITGSYCDANFVGHGFLRANNGTFATFDAPPGSPIGISPPASTRRERSQDITMMQTSWDTASCGLQMAPSLRSMPRAQVQQALSQERMPPALTPRGRLWECIPTLIASLMGS